jgi:NADPH:quinone reductase-like Zn-dependent oxidoreductase
VKAAVRDRFGAPADVVELRELDMPVPAEGEVLVRVRCASVNIADWYEVTGRPLVTRVTRGIRTPKSNRIGTDYAGVVEAVGAGVTDFAPGDEVFGGRDGAFAEYVCARADRSLTPKPANLGFDEAAAAPVAGITALQALTTKGRLQPGQHVLVHGASGGVGTYAVQIAKALGGFVTAVCSRRNVEQARSLGADRVVDYTREDFTRGGERFDLMLDIAGTRSWRECARVLAPEATVVVVGGPRAHRLLGPLGHVVGMRLGSVRGDRKVVFFVAQLTKEDMRTLAELLESGRVRSAISDRFPLDDVARALEHQGAGHPSGKIVVGVSAS